MGGGGGGVSLPVSLLDLNEILITNMHFDIMSPSSTHCCNEQEETRFFSLDYIC